MDRYTVRKGVAEKPAVNYNSLYSLPYEVSEDDGVEEVSPNNEPWPDGVDCPDCGGKVYWAETGYTPGHRICSKCGSHWNVVCEESVWKIRRARFY